jgi:hypothetical protein
MLSRPPVTVLPTKSGRTSTPERIAFFTSAAVAFGYFDR